MSRRWNRAVHLRIAPDRAIAIARAGWPRASTVATARRAIDRTVSPSLVAQSGQQRELQQDSEAIESAVHELAETAPLKGATLHVELGSPLVHFDVVRGDFAGQNDKQLQAIATACVTELLGDAASDHDVRWDLQSDERHLLICATSRAYLAMLERIATTFDLRLGSVTPDFVKEWNAFGDAAQPGCSVFALTAGADLTIALVEKGVIRAISAGPMFEPLPGEASMDEARETEREEEAARVIAAEKLDSKIGDLLLGFGLTARTRSAFSPSMPQMLDRLEMLDSRVDRLLASLGQSPSAQSAFVLIAPDGTLSSASQRWTVFSENGQPS